MELESGTINKNSGLQQVLEKESAWRSRISVQMALFFDPEEWNPLTEDTEGSKIMMKIGTQVQELLREMIQYQNVVDIPAQIIKQVENLVDIFYIYRKLDHSWL